MSLATWKKEFYRIPANKVSKNDALAHSIKKWTGLLPRNRKKHNVQLSDCTLRDKHNLLDINSRSCALCVCHKDVCVACPVFVVSTNKLGNCDDEYIDAMNNRKVAPMIKLLKKAQQKQKGKVE